MHAWCPSADCMQHAATMLQLLLPHAGIGKGQSHRSIDGINIVADARDYCYNAAAAAAPASPSPAQCCCCSCPSGPLASIGLTLLGINCHRADQQRQSKHCCIPSHCVASGPRQTAGTCEQHIRSRHLVGSSTTRTRERARQEGRMWPCAVYWCPKYSSTYPGSMSGCTQRMVLGADGSTTCGSTLSPRCDTQRVRKEQ